MNGWTAKLFDSEGNEIKIKPGHAVVIGTNGSFTQVEVPQYEAKLVYRDPETGTQTELFSEYGCTKPIDWIRSINEELHDDNA